MKDKLYRVWDEKLYHERQYCQKILSDFNNSLVDSSHLLKKIIHAKGEFMIDKPFSCRYGYNIYIGLDFYGKKGIYIDDSAKVEIGNHVIIGENVSILTACYPENEILRMQGKEYAEEVKIFDNVCIGAHTIIYPGVRIHQGAMIRPGSVIMEDIPPYMIAGGNPCKIIKAIEKET